MSAEVARHEFYTESQGDGLYDIEVSLLESLEGYQWGTKTPLCKLIGAEYRFSSTENRTVPKLTVRTRISGITDFEHDTSSFALVEVLLPTLMYEYGARREYVGVVNDLRLYPLGADPFDPEASDGDTTPGICDYGTAYPEQYPNHEPHQLAPFIPPARNDLRKLVGSPVSVAINVAAEVRRLHRELRDTKLFHPVPPPTPETDDDDGDL